MSEIGSLPNIPYREMSSGQKLICEFEFCSIEDIETNVSPNGNIEEEMKYDY